MADTSGVKNDLRVVELVKASARKPLKRQLRPEENHFICLGHFDAIRVRKPTAKENTLKTIEADIQERRGGEDNYVYPLYLLHYPDSVGDLDGFWDMRSCCMAVSRVHFAPPPAQKHSSTSEDIEKLKGSIKELSSGESPTASEELGELSAVVEGELVHCVFYHTLELGDVVVGLKSNSLNACLRVMQRILETASVADVYSYCGIHAVFQEERDWEKEGDAGFGVWNGVRKSRRTVRDFCNETIDCVSIRFSVRSVRCAELFWKWLPDREALHFVAGTADALYDFQNCRLKKFIKYIRTLLVYSPEEQIEGQLCEFTMYDAFDDVISRAGAAYGAVSSQARKLANPREAASALQQSLRAKLDGLKAFYQDRLWFSALTAQINTLLTMMDNCVTDDLTILLWPGLSALLERLESCGGLGMRQEGDIRDFLNAWDILGSDVLRLQGQLVQNPELQSSRYYTPAGLMVFYMALLFQYNALLEDINQDASRKLFTPLITYDITLRTHTLCILDDRIQPGGAEEYQGKIPLLVSLPPALMYRPFDVAVILSHEMSHYTGDQTRLRELRLEKIRKACAGTIAEAWALDGRKDYPLHDECAVDILSEIDGALKQAYRKWNEGATNGSERFIYQIRQTMPGAMRDVYFNRELQSRLAATCLDNETIRRSFVSYAKEFTPAAQNQKIRELTRHLHDSLILYRECYADLAAILCLGLGEDDYLECMFFWEYTLLQKYPDKDPERLEQLYYQNALVLDAVDSVRERGEAAVYRKPQAERFDFLKGWKQKIGHYRECIVLETDVWTTDRRERLALQSECVCLKDYLHSCAREIYNGLRDPRLEGKRRDIQALLKMIADEPDFRALHNEVAKYKEILLRES